MDHTRIWHDITTSIQYALQERLVELPEERLIARSDALLVMLPGVSGAQSLTTATFLQHYDTALYHELCRGTQPYSLAATDAGQLHDLTRAVLVSGAAEGISVEAAVGIALVLHTRGLTQFCAVPVTRHNARRSVTQGRRGVSADQPPTLAPASILHSWYR